MGYYFQNEPKNIHNTINKLFIYYSQSDPMGTDRQTDKRTDKRTNGRTNGQTDGRTNICSLFRDKLSLPKGSSDFEAFCEVVIYSFNEHRIVIRT
jgi:hypothetical protein